MAEFKCVECEKEFLSKDALDMHNNSKHYTAPKFNFDKRKVRNWGIFVFIVIVIISGGYAMTVVDLEGEHDEFAQCMTEAGVKMYGAYWCSNCATQKNMFGRSWEHVEHIECAFPNNAQGQKQICVDESIEAYPTWEFSDGSRVEGVISLERLSVLSGCEL